MTVADLGLPLVLELPGTLKAEDVFTCFAQREHCVFLDSALVHPTLGRYSFVAADPFEFWQTAVEEQGTFDRWQQRMESFHTATLPDLPPFQGGAVALLSYDLNRQFEKIASPRFDEFKMPALAVGLYDVVWACDHQTQRSWLISQGLPEQQPAARRARAEARLAEFRQLLEDFAAGQIAPLPDSASGESRIELQAPHYEVPGPAGLLSNFSHQQYLAAVQQGIDYIYAGDVFQVNLAQRLLMPASCGPLELYLRLRERNAATFAAYFDLGDAQLLSASPERFLQVQGREVESRPIKGTRRRLLRPEADLYRADELRSSEKDIAENVMIVDLLRNDLARSCLPHSVQVAELCNLESYAYVQHLVSSVKGALRPDKSPLDLLRGAFPGGSITGAPKVRAMEIIAELEPTARGAYCGSLAYLGFDGTLDSSILIRTLTAKDGWWQFPVGGGIVAQSEPQAEYEETWHKAEGMLRALGNEHR